MLLMKISINSNMGYQIMENKVDNTGTFCFDRLCQVKLA